MSPSQSEGAVLDVLMVPVRRLGLERGSRAVRLGQRMLEVLMQEAGPGEDEAVILAAIEMLGEFRRMAPSPTAVEPDPAA